ncbi:MAG: DUF86 domain-containing protein [Deltaproteobacteria bacterium]|nr:DUF86 domain-containing protein [Deltaproteobacteria bacterium]MBI5901954.1 DUF86 domain-containing protein [Deltaproteobacteria bacterium]
MPRDKVYLLDILEASRFALGYIGKKPREDFLKDTQCQDAVIRRIVIIGEAARRVSDETKSALRLPWSEMVAMRNLLIHEYDDVDMKTVWETVSHDFPPLIDSLEKILKQGDDK